MSHYASRARLFASRPRLCSQTQSLTHLAHNITGLASMELELDTGGYELRYYQYVPLSLGAKGGAVNGGFSVEFVFGFQVLGARASGCSHLGFSVETDKHRYCSKEPMVRFRERKAKAREQAKARKRTREQAKARKRTREQAKARKRTRERVFVCECVRHFLLVRVCVSVLCTHFFESAHTYRSLKFFWGDPYSW